jgi:glycosyltransferase involved in cell wall biosynthesis
VVARPDVIYAYHPPATICVPALVLRTLRRAQVVYDIQDLWPDSVAASGMMPSTWAIRLLSGLCRFIYRHSDHLVVLSPGFRQALIERGVPSDKISVVYNWCDEAHVASANRAIETTRLDELTGRFVVMFAGTMGAAQALDSVIDAAQLLGTRRPNVHFLFVGGGTEVDRLRSRAAAMSLANVSFLPRVPIAEIGPYFARADALLVHLKDDALFRITIPSKTQAYMAAGRPVLMAVGGDAAGLIEQANCGIACEPEDPARLAEAIETLAAMSDDDRRALGENGRRFYQSKFSLSAGTRAFETIFQSLCSPEPLLPSRPAPSSQS